MAVPSPSLAATKPSAWQSSWPSRLLGPVEELPWLEAASKTVMGWLQPLLDNPRSTPYKDALHGRWLGHALHPVLVDLPIGFWTSAMLLDLVGARKSARLLTAAGCAGAVGAAASGIADWSATDGRERRLGMLHGILNVTALALQVASLPSRRHYRMLSWSGSALATASAYLGGELVFGRGQMVDHDAWMAGPASWTATCKEAELADGSARPVKVAGRTVLLYRDGNRISAMEDACTHAGGPLHEGKIENGTVTCPWHGSQFRLADGACLRGPATFPQLRLEARIHAGVVEVRGRQG